MRVAIVGAGALGWAIGARLATFADCTVVLVGRVAAAPRRIRVERAEVAHGFEWTSSVDARAPEVDLVLSCVRYEHLDAMADSVAALAAPVVALTPLLPRDDARLSARLGGRWLPAMPSVVAYWSEADVLRHWIPRTATTLIEARRPRGIEVELALRLERAGIAAKVEPGVLARNVATTVSFLPLMMALDVANGIDPLLQDRPLLRLAFDAMEEGRAVGRAIGPLAGWATVVMPFLGPLMLKLGIGIVRARAPEVIRYADEHFGHKLHTQNVAMGAAMLELARDKGVASRAIERLLVLLSQE